MLLQVSYLMLILTILITSHLNALPQYNKANNIKDKKHEPSRNYTDKLVAIPATLSNNHYYNIYANTRPKETIKAQKTKPKEAYSSDFILLESQSTNEEDSKLQQFLKNFNISLENQTTSDLVIENLMQQLLNQSDGTFNKISEELLTILSNSSTDSDDEEDDSMDWILQNDLFDENGYEKSAESNSDVEPDDEIHNMKHTILEDFHHWQTDRSTNLEDKDNRNIHNVEKEILNKQRKLLKEKNLLHLLQNNKHSDCKLKYMKENFNLIMDRVSRQKREANINEDEEELIRKWKLKNEVVSNGDSILLGDVNLHMHANLDQSEARKRQKNDQKPDKKTVRLSDLVNYDEREEVRLTNLEAAFYDSEQHDEELQTRRSETDQVISIKEQINRALDKLAEQIKNIGNYDKLVTQSTDDLLKKEEKKEQNSENVEEKISNWWLDIDNINKQLVESNDNLDVNEAYKILHQYQQLLNDTS